MYINKTRLLNYIGADAERTIMQHYFPDTIDLRRTYRNPFRPNDRSPKCNFKWYNRKFLFFDNTSPDYSFDCFKLVQLKYGCTFHQALLIIAKDFNIDSFMFQSEDVSFIKNLNLSKESSIAKNETTFDYKTYLSTRREYSVIGRKFNIKDKNYWFDRYGISGKTLIKYNVLPVQELFYVNGFSNTSMKIYDYKKENELCYCYYFKETFEGKDITSVKIYRPYDLLNKWYSNTNIYHVFGYEQLPQKGKYVIITSSLKDLLCLAELGFNAIAFQSEVMSPPKSIMADLKSRFKDVIFIYDNDIPGINASMKHAIAFDCKVKFLPKTYFGKKRLKDIADFKEVFKEETKNIILKL